MEFALIRSSSKLTDTDCAFIAAAVNDQLAEAAVAWNLPAVPMAFYSEVDGLPLEDVIVIHIVDDVNAPGVLGWHSAIGSQPISEVLAQDFDGTATTVSHEALETLCDPSAEAWKPRGDGTAVALEVADPVEGDSYPTVVTLGTPAAEVPEYRTVMVSNYVFPSWFDPAGAAPYDKLGKLSAPFTMDAGGYMVIQDAQGASSEVFARRLAYGSLRAAGAILPRLGKPGGRLMRRLRG